MSYAFCDWLLYRFMGRKNEPLHKNGKKRMLRGSVNGICRPCNLVEPITLNNQCAMPSGPLFDTMPHNIDYRRSSTPQGHACVKGGHHRLNNWEPTSRCEWLLRRQIYEQKRHLRLLQEEKDMRLRRGHRTTDIFNAMFSDTNRSQTLPVGSSKSPKGPSLSRLPHPYVSPLLDHNQLSSRERHGQQQYVHRRGEANDERPTMHEPHFRDDERPSSPSKSIAPKTTSYPSPPSPALCPSCLNGGKAIKASSSPLVDRVETRAAMPVQRPQARTVAVKDDRVRPVVERVLTGSGGGAGHGALARRGVGEVGKERMGVPIVATGGERRSSADSMLKQLEVLEREVEAQHRLLIERGLLSSTFRV